MIRRLAVLAALAGMATFLIPAGSSSAAIGDDAVVASVVGYTDGDAAVPGFKGINITGLFKDGSSVCAGTVATTGKIHYKSVGPPAPSPFEHVSDLVNAGQVPSDVSTILTGSGTCSSGGSLAASIDPPTGQTLVGGQAV